MLARGTSGGLAVCLLCLFCSRALAQISSPPPPANNLKNALSVGVSVGTVNDRDADFWGWSVDYSRRITGRWSGALALTWDRETESFADRPDVEVATYTLVGSVSFAVRDWLSLTTGLGKGFADDNNSQKKMKFSDGDWSTGIALGVVTPGLPFSTRDSIGFSVSYEYNMSQNETMFSADVSYGFSF